MTVALSAGVSGLQSHQKMLDVAGNNLANVNTTAYKTSTLNFAELFSQTLANATAPTGTLGGTNPQQIGSGVGVGSIARDNSQGSIIKTGSPLDAAIEGEGYFVLSDGEQNVYTRAGTFGVDKNSNLVDISTGYLVQRTDSVGESEGFQTSGVTKINIPYDTALPANATTTITMAGNLSSDQSLTTTQTQVLESDIAFTEYDGDEAASTTTLADLVAPTATFSGTQTIAITGYSHDGSTVSATYDFSGSGGATTLGTILTQIETAIDAAETASDVTATITDGKIVITDNQSGYSQLDINLTFTNGGTADIDMPGYFKYTTVGGEEVRNVNIATYDGGGNKNILSGAFVRTDTANTWDFVVSSLTDTISSMTNDNRRIKDITFSATDGSYAGLGGTDTAVITYTLGNGRGAQAITLDLGTSGKFDGLTQLAGTSTAVATEQDGYQAGSLSSVSINNQGLIVGTYSNGIKKDIAALQIALFKNPDGLSTVGKGYYTPTANSGEALPTKALEKGAGTVHGGALEKSNTDVATEFVSLIQAQNGFQANARTIRIANDILRELTSLIR